MYQQSFGTKGQIRFHSESEYYELLGYLAKSDGSTRIVWEHNDEQGAWGQEGRIEFRVHQPPNLRANLAHTAGTGDIIFRVNCNDFVETIMTHHRFVLGNQQNFTLIRSTVPRKYHADFDLGSQL